MPTDLTIPDPSIVLYLLQGFRGPRSCSQRCRWAFSMPWQSALKRCKNLPPACKQMPMRLRVCSMRAWAGELLGRAADEYQNTPVAATYLTTASPRRLTGYISRSNDMMWQLGAIWRRRSRRYGRWKQTYGWQGPIFSHFFKTEEDKREFLMGMHGFGLISHRMSWPLLIWVDSVAW